LIEVAQTLYVEHINEAIKTVWLFLPLMGGVCVHAATLLRVTWIDAANTDDFVY
jgi:hypothetical protein